jgi:thiamine biosynthesis protein ThiS
MKTSQPAEVAICLNGERHALPRSTNVAELLAKLGLDPNAVVVELDGSILSREEYRATAFQDDARVEIVHFVGGG